MPRIEKMLDKTSAKFGLMLISTLLLCSCGEQMTKIKQDMGKLTQSMSDIRNYQAEQTTQLESLRSEVRDLTGRLDMIEHSQTSRIGSDISNLKNDLTTLRRRVPPPKLVPEGPLEADEVLVSSLPDEVGRLLNDSLQNLREGNYEVAVPALRSALDESAGKDWSANILFWLGVAYDGLNDNRNALASYHEIVSRFGKNPRAPMALSRQASVFLRLGDKSSAKLTLKKLIADYPKSDEVALAKDRLKNL